MDKVILIAHKFPPYKGVGARRWGKLSHYLSLLGVKLFVITGNWEGAEETDPNINIIKVKSFLADPDASNKLVFFLRKLFKHTDEAYSFSAKAAKLAEGLVKEHDIKTLIVTSPPYSSAYFAAKLKNKIPGLKIIQDFRDAWIDGYFSWNKRDADTHPTFNKERVMEEFALNNCDALVAVTPGLLERLKVKIKDPKIITRVITNGFDPRDIQKSPTPEIKNELLTIGHFGTLDFGREDEFITFYKSLASVNSSLQFILVGNNNNKIKDFVNTNKISNIKLLPVIEKNELHKYMRNCDFHLVVNDATFFYAFGSKVFDAFLYKKPVILISKPNELSALIHEKNIGLCSDNSTMQNEKLEMELKSMIEHKEPLEKRFKYDTFNSEAFSLPNIAAQYYEFIRSLN